MAAVEKILTNPPPLAVTGKVNEMLDVPYVVDSWRSGASWWRKWSDGTLEQGGYYPGNGAGAYTGAAINFYVPFESQAFTFMQSRVIDFGDWYTSTTPITMGMVCHSDIGGCYYKISNAAVGVQARSEASWYACGKFE